MPDVDGRPMFALMTLRRHPRWEWHVGVRPAFPLLNVDLPHQMET